MRRSASTNPARVLALISLALALAASALLPDRAAAASGWQIVLDRPTPSFGAVDFVSDSEGWMPAGAGLLHTTDGGATWTENAKLTVNDVDFFDQQHGWAVGLSGTIYGTSDGGHSWQLQTSGTSVHLSNVVAVGQREAWIVGYYAGFSDVILPPPVPSILLHTMDGGQSWQRTDAPANSSYRAISFIGEEGWVLLDQCEPSPDYGYCSYEPAPTPVLQHTIDGGQNWSLLTAPTGQDFFSDLMFLDANDGWMTGTYCSTDNCYDRGDRSAIFRTTDGGLSWAAVDTSAYGRAIALAFKDELRGWALTRACPRSGEACLNNFLSTDDGGASWLQVSQTRFDSATYGDSLRHHSGVLFKTSFSGLALRSLDEGRSWESMQTPAIEFQHLTFADSRTGFAVSGAAIVGTADAGANWQRVGDAPAGSYILSFVSRSVGFIAAPSCHPDTCGPGVSRTIDGGRTWSPILSETPLPDESAISHLRFVDTVHGLAVSQRRVFYTSDGGDTWRTQSTRADGAYFIAAELADATHAWAVTQFCSPTPTYTCEYKLASSSDAGATWQDARTLTNSVYSIQFVDRDHGWYLDTVCSDTFTCAWTLFATSDGGATWETLDLPGYPWSFTFADPRNGWINTQQCETECTGVVLYTPDGGRTWTKQLEDALLTGDLTFVDAQNGWLALSGFRGKGIGGGPPQRTILYNWTGDAINLPDVGAGTGAHSTSPLTPLLLAALGLTALAASFALRRRVT